MKKAIVRREPLFSLESLPANLHPVLRRVYAGRRMASARELERSLDHLLPFTSLKGIADAAELLCETLMAQRRILIVGDFDADGATSCALAVRALRLLGAREVHYLVPNRFEYGYGLTPEIVAVAQASRPDLLVTVDNGISSIEGVRAARARGMRVLITDHHLPGSELPEADAIVNPNQPGDLFPSKNLAGVGVIFYVMLALRARLRERGWFSQAGVSEPNLAQLLDLVALGTVADVVPLDHNNRILVSQGLARIRRGVCGAGVRALLEVAGRAAERATASDLGFALGPRLNAAGRLEDMSLGIECLLSDDIAQARALAARLDQLNTERRAIETQMREEALAALPALYSPLAAEEEADDLPFGLCLYQDNWHQGVIGILASRIKDRTHRPVIAFAPAGDGEIKGSARSIPGLHIRDALDAVAARHPGLLSRFGGHAMAAGLSLSREKFEPFSAAFDEEVRRHLRAADLRGVIYSDGELVPAEIAVDVAELLRDAGPWGQDFPEPLFDGRFHVVNRRIVGERHLKLALKPAGHDTVVDAIAFNAAEAEASMEADEVRIAYRLDVNEFRGQRGAQLRVEHLEPAR